MKKPSIENRIRIEQFIDEFIPEGVIKAPDEICDVIAFFHKGNTSAVQFIYMVSIPSRNDLEFADRFDVAFPFQYIKKGDYIVSFQGIYSCVMKEEDLLSDNIDLQLMLQKLYEQSTTYFNKEKI